MCQQLPAGFSNTGPSHCDAWSVFYTVRQARHRRSGRRPMDRGSPTWRDQPDQRLCRQRQGGMAGIKAAQLGDGVLADDHGVMLTEVGAQNVHHSAGSRLFCQYRPRLVGFPVSLNPSAERALCGNGGRLCHCLLSGEFFQILDRFGRNMALVKFLDINGLSIGHQSPLPPLGWLSHSRT